MDIKLKGHEHRKKRARDLWLRIATDVSGGISPKDVAKRYTNPYTKKPYSREHIYWIIRQVNTRSI